jgi:hypothetical protein
LLSGKVAASSAIFFGLCSQFANFCQRVGGSSVVPLKPRSADAETGLRQWLVHARAAGIANFALSFGGIGNWLTQLSAMFAAATRNTSLDKISY